MGTAQSRPGSPAGLEGVGGAVAGGLGGVGSSVTPHRAHTPGAALARRPAPEDAEEPSSKRRRTQTDLSDRAILMCAQEALEAVQRRALDLGLVDPLTSQHALYSPLEPAGSPAGGGGGGGGGAHSSSARGMLGLWGSAAGGDGGDSPWSSAHATTRPTSILDHTSQAALYKVLYAPLTALLHRTALRRHETLSDACGIGDVLRVAELAQRIFLLLPLSARGPFAQVSLEWRDSAKLCWRVDDFDLVEPIRFHEVQAFDSKVAQLSTWVRSSQHKPFFFLLALCESGRLEQLRVGCGERRHHDRGERSSGGGGGGGGGGRFCTRRRN